MLTDSSANYLKMSFIFNNIIIESLIGQYNKINVLFLLTVAGGSGDGSNEVEQGDDNENDGIEQVEADHVSAAASNTSLKLTTPGMYPHTNVMVEQSMLTFELSSYLLVIPNDADITLSRC